MEIKKNGFYLIRDDYFDKIQDSSFPSNKNGRPMYYCIEDKNDPEILWVVPMTTKMDKVNRIIDEAGGEEKCKIYVINSNEKNSAFNIRDIFPITKNYIDREYLKRGVPYILKNKGLIEKVEKKVFNMVNAKMVSKKIRENEINVQKIYKILQKDLSLSKEHKNLTQIKIPLFKK